MLLTTFTIAYLLVYMLSIIPLFAHHMLDDDKGVFSRLFQTTEVVFYLSSIIIVGVQTKSLFVGAVMLLLVAMGYWSAHFSSKRGVLGRYEGVERS